MNRSHGLLFALLFGALVVPADVMGQNPKDDRYTREASKHLGVAMLRQDEAERNAAYQAALMELQEGMVREASNPKIWFLAGQAYAGLLDFAGADSSFDKAVEMYPEYEAEVEAEREVAWVAGFQQGVALMDQQQNQEALRVFEAAHDLYPHRPEALLNMGSLYASAGDTDRAIQAFEDAIKAVNGPAFRRPR
jgi:tetratricopeptide (TPR) repeat protein